MTKQIFKAKFHNERQEILAPVLVPDETDFDGHTYTEEEVCKAKENYVTHCNKTNLQHSYDLNSDQAEFVEHYITPADMEISEQVVKKGTWMAKMHIKSQELWQSVKDGVFTGFSVQGKALHQAISKAKTAGRTGLSPTNKLSDFKFEGEDCHIALVDEAANATEILVFKSKKPNKKTETNMPEENKELELAVSKSKKLELEVKKAKELATKKELEVTKAKELASKKELEVTKAKEANEALELEVKKYREANELAEKVAFVSKAKEQKNIVKDEEAEALFVIKSKCPDQYEVVIKALETANTAIENMEIVTKPEGSSGQGALDGTVEERVIAKAKTLTDADPSLTGAAARNQAREIMRKDGSLK